MDHQTIEMFERHLEENLEKLSRTLQEGSYRPQAVRRVWIIQAREQREAPAGDSDGERPGGARPRCCTCSNRSLSGNLRRRVMGFDRTEAARMRCAGGKLLKAGYTLVVDADLKSYFDTIS